MLPGLGNRSAGVTSVVGGEQRQGNLSLFLGRVVKADPSCQTPISVSLLRSSASHLTLGQPSFQQWSDWGQSGWVERSYGCGWVKVKGHHVALVGIWLWGYAGMCACPLESI